MAEAVRTAIYKLGLDDADYRAAAARKTAADEKMVASGERVAVNEEKVSRAHRLSETALERRIARLDPAFAAERRYANAIDLVQRYEQEAVGTAEMRSRVLALETQRYEERTAALMRVGGATAAVAARTRNLSFQLVDIGQALATAPTMGIYALQNLGFQIAQIGQLYMGEGGFGQAIRDATSQVARFAARIGPAALAVGVLALGVRALQTEINESGGKAVSFGNVLQAAFEMGRDALAQKFRPAIEWLGGVWETIERIAREQFNLLVQDIGKGAAEAQYYASVIAVSWKAGVESIKAYWSSLPAAVGDIAIRTTNNALSGIEGLINRASDYLNRFIANVNSALPGSLQIGKIQGVDLPEINNPFAGGSSALEESLKRIGEDRDAELKAAAATYTAEVKRIVSTDYFADLGKRAREIAGRPTDKEKKAAEKEAERQQKAYERLTRSGEQFIAGQENERRALGQTAEQAARLRYEQDLLNRAANDNIRLTPRQTQELQKLAERMAHAEVQTQRVKEALSFAKETTRGFIDDLRQGLKEGEGFWKAFADAATNALDRIADKLIDGALDYVFRLIGGAVGGGGLSSGASALVNSGRAGLFHSGGVAGSATASRYVHPAYFDDATRYHSGGIAGLQPDEVPAILQRGERIMPAGAAAASPGTIVQVIDQRPAGGPAAEVREERGAGPNGEDLVRVLIRDEVTRMAGRKDGKAIGLGQAPGRTTRG